jgi:major vault protein
MSKRVNAIAPFEYIHVLNKNENVKRLVKGPVNFALEDHEEIVSNIPERMIVIPNLHYVSIRDPVTRDKDGKIVLDKYNLPKYRWGAIEIRTRTNFPEPFVLYPEEKLALAPTELQFIGVDQALHLKATSTFMDGDVKRNTGDEWYFFGPGHYVPSQEADPIRSVKAIINEKDCAIKLRANRNCIDKNGFKRNAGEYWLIRTPGSYLPKISEDFCEIVRSTVINDKSAIHLKALCDFIDYHKNERRAGEEWLITSDIAASHIVDVNEQLIGVESIIILAADEYCTICDPYNPETKKNALGSVKSVKGVATFFLNPGETLKDGNKKKVQILTEAEALLVQARETFKDTDGVEYVAGTKWMVKGPMRYIPRVEVKILETRRLIPLDKNEGIYIRNNKTGKVSTHIGSTYALKPEEELWQKELPENIERIYLRDLNITSRDKTKIVAYKCPFNAIMQIYNLKQKINRIVFGPELAILEPDEEFTLMSLSGKIPKEQNVVQTLYLKIGPIFSTDEFDVETVDHTRLKLRISYNWLFDIKKGDEASALKIFTIRDFVGDMTSTLASRIRSFIATFSFEDFHKNSDRMIKRAVFGENEHGEIGKSLRYEDCLLVINDVDIQSVTPSDPTTQKLLQQSVSLAIELATKTIEQEYTIQALIREQEFKGELTKISISNEIDFLNKHLELNKLKVESTIIEKTGLSKAQAEAYKDATNIESKSNVILAEMTKQADEIETEFDLKKKIKEYNSKSYNNFRRLS